jgi:hypothetical protein
MGTMNKINTAQGEWTIIQARYNASDDNFGEVIVWSREAFGPSGPLEGSCSRWLYLTDNKFGFLFEEDALMFALRWS